MTITSSFIQTLKENDQDFEWYPTTNEMIQAVLRKLPEKALSIMDIGAGDGRVLMKFAEKCKIADLYSIEISSILRQEQDKGIIPVGTDLFEQNLATLQVEYIFCNPRYSQFEKWMCKIITEGYAKYAYLIVPQRWKDSNEIKRSLEKRGADAHVIWSGDFYKAERQARAVIDIVQIMYKRDRWGEKVEDPFDKWFDDNVKTFDAYQEPKSSYDEGKELARKYKYASIDEMVAAYLEEMERLRSNYEAVFRLDLAILDELGVKKDDVKNGLKMKMRGLKVKYWELLFTRLDVITSRLTTKSKKILLEKLTHNTKVEFTAHNAYSIVIWAIKNANQYFDDQLVQCFEDLATFESVYKYKSNIQTWEKGNWRWYRKERGWSHYQLDYRIVLDHSGRAIRDDKRDYFASNYDYPGNLYKERHEMIADIIAVLSNLGFTTDSLTSYNREWTGGKWQDWYKNNSDEILFQVKAYMNGNLHLRFDQEAIKAINIEAARILKWVKNEKDVVEEMGYTPEDARKYFNHTIKITANKLPLLASSNLENKVIPIQEKEEREEDPEIGEQQSLF